jgi:hypothetical protein
VKDIIVAFEKEYYPMDFFSNQQCAQHFVKGWCAATGMEKLDKIAAYIQKIEAWTREDNYSLISIGVVIDELQKILAG